MGTGGELHQKEKGFLCWRWWERCQCFHLSNEQMIKKEVIYSMNTLYSISSEIRIYFNVSKILKAQCLHHQ